MTNIFLQENAAGKYHQKGKKRNNNQSWKPPSDRWFKRNTDASRLDSTSSRMISHVCGHISRKIIKKIAKPNMR